MVKMLAHQLIGDDVGHERPIWLYKACLRAVLIVVHHDARHAQ